MNKVLRIGATALVAGGLPVMAHAAPNLVANGGFETGSFSGWTLGGDASGLRTAQNTDNVSSLQSFSGTPWKAHTGTWFAVFGSEGTSSLTQVIGGSFNSFSLDLWAGGAGFQVLWDGELAQGNGFSVENGFGGNTPDAYDATLAENGFERTRGFEKYTFLLPGSAAASHRLQIRNLGLPSAFGYIPVLDSVMLAGVGAANVPEPPAIMLMGIGLLGLTGALYRKKGRANGLMPTGSLDPKWIRRRLAREEGTLRRAGVEKLVFAGSAARGTGHTLSDVDAIATFTDGLRLRSLKDLLKLTILERHLAFALGRHVDLLPEDTLADRVRLTTQRDAIQVF